MSSGRRRQGDPRPSRLSGFSGLLIRHPRLALAAWVLVVLVLAVAGRNLADHLEPHPLYVEGTQASQAHEITLRQFGSDESMVVALSGPRAAVAKQGKELATRLDSLPKTLVVSPWSPGTAIGGLRPQPDVAGIVVRVEHRDEDALTEMLELVEGQVERTVTAPVEASIAGLPKIYDSYAEANESAARTGEMIALPLLLLVLLLVFRSVIAALIPVFVGGATVAATEGVMRLTMGVFQIDAFALGAAGMMGLALGVDYSLLVVSRFREERGKSDLATAVQTTIERTARSILPAAAGLLLAMLIAPQVLPGAVVSSSALAIMIATVFSAFSALFAVPAAVVLLGDNLERLTLPQRRRPSRNRALGISSRIARRPGLVMLIVLGLVALSAFSATLDTAIGTPALLPKGAEGRVEAEHVEETLGPGWLAPIEIIVSGKGEPMTSPRRLRSLATLQERVQNDPGVEKVAGLRTLQRRLAPLSSFEEQLASQQRGSRRLSDGLGRAVNGAQQNSSGILAAAAGASEVSRSVGEAGDGAGLLTQGLRDAGTGSSRIDDGLSLVSDGIVRLAKNTSEVSSGVTRLADEVEEGLDDADEQDGDVNSLESAMNAGNGELEATEAPLKAAEERLASAWGAVKQMTTGTSDPQYAALRRSLAEAQELLSGKRIESDEVISPPYEGVAVGIERVHRQFDLGLYLADKMATNNARSIENTERLIRETRRLDRGIQNLVGGAEKVADGVATLDKEGSALTPAVQRLQEGTESLAKGLGGIAGGAGELSSGLGGGAGSADRLAGALARMQTRLETTDPDGLQRLRASSPHLFDSGYFFLAGLDGSEPSRRNLTNFMIDIERGGHTARMMIIPKHPVSTEEGKATLARLHDDARAFSEATGTEAVVGGLSASLFTVDETLEDRTAIARLALMLVTVIVLIPVLRSLLIPLVAAFLNLLTVFATLGALALLFNNSLLGGPGYVDAGDIPAVMMVIFGLAIDYEVFIFARMREEYARTGSTKEAVDNGLARTAPVITGAATIMITVFLCFSISAFVTLRNFGVAQAFAVFLDAFIIRLIIVPAVMKGLGKWCWWMPGWLDRLLPGGSTPKPS
ncbi:MAG TPA: MMPL family transporter [Solirubrobacterales bacterium]|nr:MMPL family transporter [Solirubrobacterales bacterium]